VDGIFGIGVAEMLIIALVLFIIGGPTNTAKWARELGRLVRQIRLAWAQTLAELEREMGPEGKEILDAARELGQGAREVTRLNPTRNLVADTLRMVEDATDLREDRPAAPGSGTEAPPSPASTGSEAPSAKPTYSAWLPPDKSR
jgi:Sec-independent protein translocase protein TatA